MSMIIHGDGIEIFKFMSTGFAALLDETKEFVDEWEAKHNEKVDWNDVEYKVNYRNVTISFYFHGLVR